MFGWFFKLFAARKFKSQAHLPFGLIRAFKEMIFARIDEIIETTQHNLIQLTRYYNRYSVLNNSLQECYYNKDEFDFVTRYNDPIISPAQESRLRFYRKMYWLSLFVFFVVETILFYMIAQNITGGMVKQIENMGRQYAGLATAFLFFASAMFALFSALILDMGLRQLFYYFKAKKHYENKFIDKAAFRSAVVRLIIGISLLAGAVIVLLLMNWARSYAIDGAATNSASHNPVLVYALIALSIFGGIGFGWAKKELAENSELLSLAKKWKKITDEMADTYNRMSELAIRIRNQYSLVVNKSHSMGVDLQEIMEREYDERDADLLLEYRAEMKRGKFHIVNDNGSTSTSISPGDATYYATLATNEMVIHNNHFSSHERLVAIMEAVNRMVAEVAAMEKERLSRRSEDANKTMVKYNELPELSTTHVETIFNKQTNYPANGKSITQ